MTSTSRSGTEPFRLDFRVDGGPIMTMVPTARGGAAPIHQRTTWMRVHGGSGGAVLVSTWSTGEPVDRPIGLFRTRLGERRLARLQRAVESTRWERLPVPEEGSMSSRRLEIDYARGNTIIRRCLDARSLEWVDAAWLLMDVLQRCVSAVTSHPVGALRVFLHATPDPGDAHPVVLWMVVENVGTGAIVVSDPRVPRPSGVETSRARLLVAATRGMTTCPARWSTLALPGLGPGEPERHELRAGERLAIAVPWRPPGPGSYVAQAVWQDYAGPSRAEAGDSAVPSLDDDERPMATGPYPVRGTAFSVRVPIHVPRRMGRGGASR